MVLAGVPIPVSPLGTGTPLFTLAVYAPSQDDALTAAGDSAAAYGRSEGSSETLVKLRAVHETDSTTALRGPISL
jgi:hypothetical protein